MTYQPRPGDLFLTRIKGALGAAVSLGQTLAGDLSPLTHAGVIVSATHGIAAQPGGARIDPLDVIFDQGPVAVLPVPAWAEDRRADIVATALSWEGLPYGWMSYPFIGLSKLGLAPAWMKAYVASPESMICSAFADRAWQVNGINLFRDSRPLGAVTPGDLAHCGTVHHVGTGPWDAYTPADEPPNAPDVTWHIGPYRAPR